MTSVTRRQQIAAIAAAVLGGFIFARAAAADPPDRVGRLSQVIGPVSVRPATLDDWGDAVPNYPLTSGDNVWTDRAARVEVQLGGATARLGADSSFGVLNLDDRIAQFRLTQGSAALTVDAVSDQMYEVDTPNAAVSLLQPGFYRIDVNDAGDLTTVAVRQGAADVTSGDGRPIVLHDGESVMLAGLDNPRVDFAGVRGSDEWEDWCRWRDRSARQAVSGRYVSPYTVGYSDLDEFGTWRNIDEYGPVWIPRVRAGWAPYREGRWVWTEPWGWTWVDDQPWGFAPSHYGRWVNMNGMWGWWPGSRVDRAIYAPALVAFIGGGGGQDLLYGDTVAWFPLGPGEPYVPPYRVSPNYVRAINVTSVRGTTMDPTRINYVNRIVPGAVTAVPRGTFVTAQPVLSVARPLPVDAIRQGRIVGTAPPVAPAPSSVVVKVRDRAPAPDARVIERPVLARTQPPPPPVPLAARESALKEHPGQPVDPRTVGELRARTGSAPAAPPVRVVAAESPARGRGRQDADAAAPAVGRPPRQNERPNEPAAASSERSAQPAPRTSEPPERQEESRTTPVPRRVQPATPPEPPQPARAVPRQNGDDGQLAAQQAAERARLEAQHADEQAKFEAQRAEAQRRAQDARAQAQLQQQEDKQKRQMDDRQVREHQQLQQQQQQQADKAKQRQAEQAKAQHARPAQAQPPKPPQGQKPKPKEKEKEKNP
jgi:uncharacterized protein DUF6600/FecR-like protein